MCTSLALATSRMVMPWLPTHVLPSMVSVMVLVLVSAIMRLLLHHGVEVADVEAHAALCAGVLHNVVLAVGVFLEDRVHGAVARAHAAPGARLALDLEGEQLAAHLGRAAMEQDVRL